jgi:hypothetical protein
VDRTTLIGGEPDGFAKESTKSIKGARVQEGCEGKRADAARESEPKGGENGDASASAESDITVGANIDYGRVEHMH